MKPRALRPGDQIRVVSPASPLTPEQVAQGVELLESEGYRVTFGQHVYDKLGYLAGRDEDRARDLNEAFADPDVAAIYCSRGGYGCARLLPHLDLDMMAASGKLFAGFSDVTTLHLALNRRGLPTLHAPMLITLSVDREPWVTESVRRNLRGDNTVPETAATGNKLVGGQATGTVTGGCMCLLCDSIGTDDALDTTGRIVIIEDVDEAPHRVDAMLTHLRNRGDLQRAAGIVFGEMTRTDERVDEGIGAWKWRDIIADRVGDLGVPTIVDYPFGHAPQMLSLPLGIEAALDADAGTLTYREPLCEPS